MSSVRTMFLATGLLWGSQALACGGFFCDQAAPRDTQLFDPGAPRVDQTSERIVFAVDEEAGKVEVHVQVAYEGSVDEFGWVVPVPKVPDLFVSPQRLFDQLEGPTAAVARLDYRVEGRCKVEQSRDFSDGGDVFSDSGSLGAEAPNDADESDTDDGVTVVARQEVGPYETVTLSADSAEELVAWLDRQDFTLPDDANDALAPYVAGGSYFVALRLRKDREAGDIVPFGMRYDGTEAQIPIVLTRIAAVEDMRLIVWVLANGRAVPKNYLHVLPNLTLLDWWSGGSNWRELIARAADEAGGQAFTTDYAGKGDMGLVWSESWFDQGELARAADAFEWLTALRGQTIATFPTTLSVLQRRLQLAESDLQPGDTMFEVYNCPSCYEPELRALSFNRDAANSDLLNTVVIPLQRAQDLLTNSEWVTRLTSSMSPSEMTADPIFTINPDMGQVDQARTATQVTLCNPDVYFQDAKAELRIDGGPTVPLPSGTQMDRLGLSYGALLQDRLGGPKAGTIERTGRQGQPQLIQDNSAEIDALIAKFAAEFELDEAAVASSAGCGCDGLGGAGGSSALLLLALGALRRRREA